MKGPERKPETERVEGERRRKAGLDISRALIFTSVDTMAHFPHSLPFFNPACLSPYPTS